MPFHACSLIHLINNAIARATNALAFWLQSLSDSESFGFQKSVIVLDCENLNMVASYLFICIIACLSQGMVYFLAFYILFSALRFYDRTRISR